MRPIRAQWLHDEQLQDKLIMAVLLDRRSGAAAAMGTAEQQLVQWSHCMDTHSIAGGFPYRLS